MLKKYIVLILIFSVFTLNGCSSSSAKPSSKNDVATTGESTEKEPTELPKTPEPPAPAETTINEFVALDQDGVKITVKDLDFNTSFLGPGLKILIENSTDKNITVQSENLSVNDIMIDNVVFSCDIAAGKSANDTIDFISTDLKSKNITDFAEIELQFIVIDDSFTKLFTSEPIKIETSSKDTYTQVNDSNGSVIFEENGIKITSQGISSDSHFMGPSMILFIENNTDQNVIIQSDNVSVNGFMVNPIMSCNIAANKKAITGLTFMNSELEENGIENITQVEMSFTIFDDSLKDIVKTPIISTTLQ